MSETETDTTSFNNRSFDRISFIMGMITAFGECLASECKRGALSPPFYPEDRDRVWPAAQRVARQQGLILDYEENRDMAAEGRLHWLVMAKFPEGLKEYHELRHQGFNPVWDFEKFFNFLSYGTVWGEGADRVIPRIREKKAGLDTVAQVLLKPGDWPPRYPE